MPDGPATDRPEAMELTLPTDFKAIVLVGIFSLLFLYALYITGEILVPVIIGFLLKMVLQPATDMLVAFHFPRFLAALLVVGVLLGSGDPVRAAAAQVLVLIGLLAAEGVAVVVTVELIARGRIRRAPPGGAAPPRRQRWGLRVGRG